LPILVSLIVSVAVLLIPPDELDVPMPVVDEPDELADPLAMGVAELLP